MIALPVTGCPCTCVENSYTPTALAAGCAGAGAAEGDGEGVGAPLGAACGELAQAAASATATRGTTSGRMRGTETLLERRNVARTRRPDHGAAQSSGASP